MGPCQRSAAVYVSTHLSSYGCSWHFLGGRVGSHTHQSGMSSLLETCTSGLPFLCCSARKKAAMELAKEKRAIGNYRNVQIRLVPLAGTCKTMVMATCGENQDQDIDWYLEAPKDHLLMDIRPYNWWQNQVDFVKSPKIRHRIRELLEKAEGIFGSLDSLALTREEAAKLHKAVGTFSLLKRAQFEETKFRSQITSSMSFLDQTPWDDPATSPNQWAHMVEVWEKEDKIFSKTLPKTRNFGKGPDFQKGGSQQKESTPQRKFSSRKPPPKSKRNNKRNNDGKCWKCNQTGHIQRNCPMMKGQTKRASETPPS